MTPAGRDVGEVLLFGRFDLRPARLGRRTNLCLGRRAHDVFLFDRLRRRDWFDSGFGGLDLGPARFLSGDDPGFAGGTHA